MRIMSETVIGISNQLAFRLQSIAHKSNVSVEALAERAIDFYLETEEWQIAEIECGLSDAQAGQFITDEETMALFRQYTS